MKIEKIETINYNKKFRKKKIKKSLPKFRQ